MYIIVASGPSLRRSLCLVEPAAPAMQFAAFSYRLASFYLDNDWMSVNYPHIAGMEQPRGFTVCIVTILLKFLDPDTVPVGYMEVGGIRYSSNGAAPSNDCNHNHDELETIVVELDGKGRALDIKLPP